ncbi:hypothetical protein PMI42_02381 [Bradyrhizobium sp. YR681]|nr:hypothetical protein PMI42_02381 [Bradyrhizobium sp. YR681]
MRHPTLSGKYVGSLTYLKGRGNERQPCTTGPPAFFQASMPPAI